VTDGALLIVVWIPLIVVWAAVMVDLVRQPRIRTASKVAWAVSCTLLWPVLILYLLSRPTLGRLEVPEERTDPHALLVDAALDHEVGRIDDATMATAVRELRRR
jgi:hypothetical protein